MNFVFLSVDFLPIYRYAFHFHNCISFIVFDFPFSPETELKRRNIKKNIKSKLNRITFYVSAEQS